MDTVNETTESAPVSRSKRWKQSLNYWNIDPQEEAKDPIVFGIDPIVSGLNGIVDSIHE